MGASPLYVYMYVAMNNMLVYCTALEKWATQTYFLNFTYPAESAGILDLIDTTPSPASCPMSNHPSIHQPIYLSIH